MDCKDVHRLYAEEKPLIKLIKRIRKKMPDKVLYQAFSDNLVFKKTTDIKSIRKGDILIPLSYKE